MKDVFRLIAALGGLCLVSGLLLAWTNEVTRTPIAEAQKKELVRGLRNVLPECDNDLLADAKRIEEGGREWVFYIARKGTRKVGVAFRGVSPRGYGGPVEALVGLLPDGRIHELEIRPQRETPGLGTKVAAPAFRDQFKGKTALDTQWAALQKEGGEILAITGATISSSAATEAVRMGLEVFRKHRSIIWE